jgi:short-subunit dehydrogenase
MDQSVIITGASAGIGRALALEFAARGYHLGLTGRRREALESVRQAIVSRHGQLRVELALLDVTDTDAVAPAIQGLARALGGVDIVVVNAGVNDLTLVGRGDLAKEIAIINTNLSGAIATVHAATQLFLDRGRGQIVGISSLAALQRLPRQAAYCASKAGFSMYLDVARSELAGSGITVTEIRPGFVTTDIVEGLDIARIRFAVSAERASEEMRGLIEKRVATGVVPAFPWRLLRPLIGRIPPRFLDLGGQA